MVKLEVHDLAKESVKGVQVMLPADENVYQETFFEWRESALTVDFSSCNISGGVLKAWHHTPVFSEIETHVDHEMFYFLSGTAIMLFVDIVDQEADLSSAQLVRIQAGTQIIIEAGKGHFVAVAENDEPVQIIVVSPKMDAPRTSLPDSIAGS